MTTLSTRKSRLERAIQLKRQRAASKDDPSLPRRPQSHPALLGDLQEGLWLHYRLDPSSPSYNLASAFRSHGEIECSRLARALGHVVEKHRLLRSTFELRHNRVEQIIHRDCQITIDRREVDAEKLIDTAVEIARQPFVLDKLPLLRLAVLEERQSSATEGRTHPLLLLVLHHIVVDERSLGILWRELAHAYRRGSLDETSQVQYDDYVEWARRSNDEDFEFWRHKLEPLPSPLELTPKAPRHPRSRAQAMPGRLIRSTLPAEASERILEFAAAMATTPFALFAFCFRLLLQRYSSHDSFAFATPVSTRSHPATAEMIGYFSNPVVIPESIDESMSVAEAVRAFGGAVRELLSHASIPFHRLSKGLGTAGDQSLFQSMFVYQEAMRPINLGNVRLSEVRLDLGEAKFDLTLFVERTVDGFEVAAEFRTELFEPLWVEQLLEHYRNLASTLPLRPEVPAANLEIMATRELDQLSRWSQGSAVHSESIIPLPKLILDQATERLEQVAVICGDRTFTYQQLVDSAIHLAAKLRSEGIGDGDRVALLVERSVHLIAAVLGIQLANAAYVPLDPNYPLGRTESVLDDAEVGALVTTSGLAHSVESIATRIILVDHLDPSARPDTTSTSEGAVDIDPTSTAYLLYTSGSTGRPKGVVVSHENLSRSTAARLQAYDFLPERFLLLPSIAFDSSIAGLFWTFATGGTLIVPSDREAQNPALLGAVIARHRVTSLLCVPSLFDQISTADPSRLASLEAVIVAGEQCPPQLVSRHFQRLPTTRLINEYGPTETTVWATVHELNAVEPHIPIGRPIPGVRVEVLDRRQRPVPIGVAGEAWITGPTVASGYWRRPELTDAAFSTIPGGRDRRYRTGDRMMWTADGTLLFLGRSDDQIKLRGFRIEPGDIEAALLGSAGVEQAAVVVRSLGSAPDADLAQPQQLIAFVEGAIGAQWRRELATHLPRHMIPNRVIILDQIPRTANGKVDRKRLRSWPIQLEVSSVESNRIPTNLEHALISLWKGLLGEQQIGPRDNFFELGGHSLLVVEMAVAIERDFGVELAAPEIFAHPTIEELARLIDSGAAKDQPLFDHLFPIQPGGTDSPLIVSIPHFFSAGLAAHFRGQRPVYGLRGVGLRSEGNFGRWKSMQELATELVAEITHRFPDQSYVMAGYSFGATMAVEAVRLMEARGIVVEHLLLIAPMPLDLYHLGPLSLQIEKLQQPVRDLGAGQALQRWCLANHPLRRRPYQRLRYRTVTLPWRHLLRLIGRLRRWRGLPLSSRILHADLRIDRFRLHRRYVPEIVVTPTVIFNPIEPDTNAASTWEPYFQGSFSIRDVPDPHRGQAAMEATQSAVLDYLDALGAA